MTSMSLTVGSILFHKELLVFDKSSVVKSVQWGSCCCPLALLGTHSDINEIPLLTPLSTLEISHCLINRHSASLHVIYLPSCTLMSVWSTSFSVVALTHWSDWLDCLFNYKVCFTSYFAVHNVHHLCELILNPDFCCEKEYRVKTSSDYSTLRALLRVQLSLFSLSLSSLQL